VVLPKKLVQFLKQLSFSTRLALPVPKCCPQGRNQSQKFLGFSSAAFYLQPRETYCARESLVSLSGDGSAKPAAGLVRSESMRRCESGSSANAHRLTTAVSGRAASCGAHAVGRASCGDEHRAAIGKWWAAAKGRGLLGSGEHEEPSEGTSGGTCSGALAATSRRALAASVGRGLTACRILPSIPLTIYPPLHQAQADS
jgi:hypothetical protein